MSDKSSHGVFFLDLLLFVDITNHFLWSDYTIAKHRLQVGILKIIPFLADPDGWIAVCAPIFGIIKAIPEQLVFYRRHNKATSDAHKKKRITKKDVFFRLLKTKYQEYFIYPHAERITYTKIKEYLT